MDFEIKSISFEEILPIWKNFLWPERTSVIENVSCIDQWGKIDVGIRQFKSEFYGCYFAEKIAGVISCHAISSEVMRIRGIYVFESYRNNRIGSRLISRVKTTTFEQNYKKIFGLVRANNETYFKNAGFVSYGRIGSFEYGPHILMELSHSEPQKHPEGA